MPNQITAEGLQTATKAEQLEILKNRLRDIYGDDINLASDSPDGQNVEIFVQIAQDILDLVTSVYNGMDPDTAIGVTLDRRVAYNGVKRQGGTYTTTNLTVVLTQGATLNGLDTETPYTVRDEEGNRWFLASSQTQANAGTYVYLFRAEFTGAINTTPGTINKPVTIVLGVQSVNNPTVELSTGQNEELDSALKIRRQKSVALPSQGFVPAMRAALLNVPGVTSAFVYENDQRDTNADGVPGNCVWPIVAGAAADADIANAIYLKRGAGCATKGAKSRTVTQSDGSPWIVRWDSVADEDLLIKITLTSLDGVNAPNVALIKAQLPIVYKPAVYAQVNLNELANYIQKIDPNALLVLTAGDGLSRADLLPTYSQKLFPSARNKQFVIKAANTAVVVV